MLQRHRKERETLLGIETSPLLIYAKPYPDDRRQLLPILALNVLLRMVHLMTQIDFGSRAERAG
jgi:hypothetical protein